MQQTEPWTWECGECKRQGQEDTEDEARAAYLVHTCDPGEA